MSFAVAILTNVAMAGSQSEQIAAYKKALKEVPAVEMPAKAASVVAKAKAKEQEETALNVLRAVMEISPASGPAVVGAIARVAPATASKLIPMLPAQYQPSARAAASFSPAAVGVQEVKDPYVADPGPTFNKTDTMSVGTRRYSAPN